MAKGKVKFFNKDKGFGFIAPEDGGPDVFVHITGLAQHGMELRENDVVTFEVVLERGKKAAKDVKKA